MFRKEDLKYDDIITKPIPAMEYINSIPENSYREKYLENYRTYIPNKGEMVKIKRWLDKTVENKLIIVGIGAKWCPDCTRNLGNLVKIEETLSDPRFKVEFIGGIKVKMASLRKQGEPIWHAPPSPPESIDPKFDVELIPIFYLFDKDRACLGRVVENPELTGRMEGDIVKILYFSSLKI